MERGVPALCWEIYGDLVGRIWRGQGFRTVGTSEGYIIQSSHLLQGN